MTLDQILYLHGQVPVALMKNLPEFGQIIFLNNKLRSTVISHSVHSFYFFMTLDQILYLHGQVPVALMKNLPEFGQIIFLHNKLRLTVISHSVYSFYFLREEELEVGIPSGDKQCGAKFLLQDQIQTSPTGLKSYPLCLCACS